MKIYVAGSTRDLRTATSIAESLEAEGHTITFKWYDPNEGEIRLDGMRSEDLKEIESGVVGEDYSVVVRHAPTGREAAGRGSSRIAAHDVAVNKLRLSLKDGWAADPLLARSLAEKEMQAVLAADIVVLVWHPAIYGAMLETGAALFKVFLDSEGKTYIFRPGRDSVFWYMEHTEIVWTKTDLLESVAAYESEERP